MSSGNFVNSFYEANNGDIYAIRLQPETIDAAFNPAPAGPADQPTRARVSGSRRGYGMFARMANFSRQVGTPPNAVSVGLRLPILTPDAANELEPNDTISYQTNTWTFTSLTGEVKR
jgi:hypothetical protein